MLMAKRKPVTVGEMLLAEFTEPIAITQTQLAAKAGLPRKHVNELCRAGNTFNAIESFM